MILKGLLAIIILLIIPVLLGFLFVRFLKEEKNNIFLAIVLGYIIEFAICQLISVPMIFAEATFTIFLNTYFTIIFILCAFSIILNIKKIKEIFCENIKIIKSFPKLLTILTVVLIIFQIYGFVI